MLFEAFPKNSRSRFGSYEIILLASIVPLVVEILTFTGLTSFSRVEILPFALTLAALGFSEGLLNQRPKEESTDQFNRDAVVEGMDEGWMVLDPENVVVDINPAAERMAGVTRDKVIHQPIGIVLGDLANLGLTFNGRQELRGQEEHQVGVRLAIFKHPHLDFGGPCSQTIWPPGHLARYYGPKVGGGCAPESPR